jgi:serine/threonine protein kinase
VIAARASNEAFDRYEVLAPLGRGGFATVYRARHRHTGREVALKVTDPDGDPELVARALNEARITAAIRHPSLVEVFDCGPLPDGRVFVAMEHIEGLTLEALLEREGGTLVPGRAVWLAQKALSALEVVHAQGVIHRDIKPSNLLVRWDTRGEQLYVIDFGISKIVSLQTLMTQPGTMMGAILGTPGYMPPEQLDARAVDVRADIYGVAAVLYRAISGRRPYEAKSLEAWITQVTEAPPPPLAHVAPHVPPALGQVIDRALARDRDARPPTARAFREALEAALSLESALAGDVMRTVPVPLHEPSYANAPLVHEPSYAHAPTLALVTPRPQPQPRPASSAKRTWVLVAASCAASVAIALLGAYALARSDAARTTPVAPSDGVVLAGAPYAPKEEDVTEDAEEASVEAEIAEAEREIQVALSDLPMQLTPPSTSPRRTAAEANAHREAEGASEDTEETPPGRRVQFVSALPVGDIEMAEVKRMIRRAMGRIDACYSGTTPKRISLLLLFRTTAPPMISPLGDQSDVGRCAAAALVSAARGQGTRSSGVLRDIIFAWR